MCSNNTSNSTNNTTNSGNDNCAILKEEISKQGNRLRSKIKREMWGWGIIILVSLICLIIIPFRGEVFESNKVFDCETSRSGDKFLVCNVHLDSTNRQHSYIEKDTNGIIDNVGKREKDLSFCYIGPLNDNRRSIALFIKEYLIMGILLFSLIGSIIKFSRCVHERMKSYRREYLLNLLNYVNKIVLNPLGSNSSGNTLTPTACSVENKNSDSHNLCSHPIVEKNTLKSDGSDYLIIKTYLDRLVKVLIAEYEKN